MKLGWGKVRTSRTVTRRLCGHAWGEPSEVFDQSKARVRAPSSPPPAKKSPTSSPSIRKNLTQTPAAEPYRLQRTMAGLGESAHNIPKAYPPKARDIPAPPLDRDIRGGWV